ncbi:putative alkaline serine protease AorO [Mollisia scopiformis]|uniref:tripeptidyl-peptidase II n=1 Tax=Mollisia scopiformis TaxID=149040 RepID=A0A194XUL4_MOLSC|nr:putative alkaline serine protease AorO [Mollisia scopiformis]KUJ23903.1 putative alkaline serine protease AorO [Mollisia scopiformis]
MRLLTLATATFLISLSFAVPTPHNGHVVHEKRTHSAGLVRRHRAPPATTVPVRIGFSQSNLDIAHELLMELADPMSDNYGKHMSAKEVGDLFRPKSESIESVRDWLHSSGIDIDRHQVSPGRGWLKFEATIDELESLLSTEYHVYEHSDTEALHIGCDTYHVPLGVHPHIDFISPTVSTIQIKRGAKKQKRGETTKASPASFPPIVKPANLNLDPASFASDASTIPCYTAVTPDCLRTLYGIPKGSLKHKGNEIGIFEDGDWYDQQDLDLTFAAISPNIPNGSHPALEGIDGGIAPFSFDGFEQIGIESLLDMSIIMPLVYPQTAVLFQVDDLTALETSSGFGDTFLDALDASYCTFEGGDDPTLDPQYPDTAQAPGAANGTGITYPLPEMCGAYKPTNVISVSYGLGENTFSFFYENRQCVEYLKLGLQGTTVVYASGDSGVSNRGECIVPSNATYNGDPGAFSPSFPAACPYLTSVGATQINPDDRTETAVAVADEEYYSGGGFSNYWATPDYQQSTLKNYFKKTPPPYNFTSYGNPYYNSSGRGYPDVAAVGLNILLYADGQPTFVGGTSASAPIFASIISLINEKRLAAGKTTVGFINPTLYKNPHAFTDITTGSNPGCNTNGFSAVKDWDPVTGLGTPKFSKLLDVFMALP